MFSMNSDTRIMIGEKSQIGDHSKVERKRKISLREETFFYS